MKKILFSSIFFLAGLLSINAQTLYSTTFSGGSDGGGSITKFIPATNSLTVARSFESFASNPYYTNLVQATDGKLYGMTSNGGKHEGGIIFTYDPLSSIYTKLKDFDDTNGRTPYGSLIQAIDGKLYGMTNNGGNNNNGVIFSYEPSTSTFTKLKDFDYTNGASPFGSLVQSGDGKLYGMTNSGGDNGLGVIFSYDLSSSTYTKLWDFDNTNGANPYGSLMQASNGKLYGLTVNGGSSAYGVMFSYDPSNSIFTKLKDFDGTNGGNPYGSLLQAGNGKLYGLTVNGGSNAYGVMFSYDPSVSAFAKLMDFDGISGANPYGSLMQASDGNLYGMTKTGGSNDYGVVFSFNPSSSIYTKLTDFDKVNGNGSFGSFVQASDGKLYGMTYNGGNGGAGVFFSYEPANSVYSKLIDFNKTNGSGLYGKLTLANNGKFYGMTFYGGSKGVGVFFSYEPLSSAYTILKDFDITDGSYPTGSLIQANDGKLYGMTDNGGSSDAGVLFSYDPTSSAFIKLRDFDNINGSRPYGSLLQANNGKLYGITFSGGSNGAGVIFSYDPSTFVYVKLHDFNFTNGASPYGSLIQADNGKLYGMTSSGGNEDYEGVIFSYDPSTSVYTKLKNFSDLDGTHPRGTFIQAGDGKLYGMTSEGGLGDAGVIFSFDPSSLTYKKLKDFDNPNGANPFGNLLQASDGKLYGMTNNGGSNNMGVIFLYDPSSSSYTKLKDFNGDNGAHPGIGSAFIEAKTPPTITLTTLSDDTTYIGPLDIKLSATATDADGSISKVELYNGETLLATERKLPYAWTWKNVPVGEYTLTAKAYDDDSLVNTSSPVHITVTANQPPVVSLTTPADNTEYITPISVFIKATANDSDGKIKKVEFYEGTTLLATDKYAGYGIHWKDVPPGEYTLTAKAYDNYGDVSTSAPVHITVSLNKAPTVSIINPANNQTYTGPATINLEAAAKDPDGSISKVVFYNEETILATEYKLPYTYKWKNVEPGEYAITAKATDNSGVEVTSAIINISVVANEAPTVSIINPANEESFTAPATIEIKAIAKDADGSISKVEFYEGARLLRTERYLGYSWKWKDVGAGTYTITAKATDNHGAATISAPVSITVESPEPPLLARGRISETLSKADINAPLSIKLSPNPARNILNISTEGIEINKQATITIISSSGAILKTILSNKLIQALDVSALAKGVYAIRILSGDKILYRKLVKL